MSEEKPLKEDSGALWNMGSSRKRGTPIKRTEVCQQVSKPRHTGGGTFVRERKIEIEEQVSGDPREAGLEDGREMSSLDNGGPLEQQ